MKFVALCAALLVAFVAVNSVEAQTRFISSTFTQVAGPPGNSAGAPAPSFSQRFGVASVVRGSEVLVLGGKNDAGFFNDVHVSANTGSTWTVRNVGTAASSSFIPRRSHAAVTIPNAPVANTIVVVAGLNAQTLNDAWQSTDGGATWTALCGTTGTNACGFDSRQDPVLLYVPATSNNGNSPFLVLIGGANDASFRTNTVYRSSNNGLSWTVATASPGWPGRWMHAGVVVPDGTDAGRIIISGGQEPFVDNDVWASFDGITWTQLGASASRFTNRYGHGMVYFCGVVYVVGGDAPPSATLNDVWGLDYQTNPNGNWQRIGSTSFSVRQGFGCNAIGNAIVVIAGAQVSTGGAIQTYFNDVWASQVAPWTTSAYGTCQCSGNTGVGIQTRTVSCSFACGCSGTQPVSSQTCACNTYQYRYTAFTGCPTCLQTGQSAFATRTAICQVSTNGGASFSDDTANGNNNCVAAGVTLLALTQQCTGLPTCAIYQYRYTAFTGCPSCLQSGQTAFATRTAICQVSNNGGVSYSDDTTANNANCVAAGVTLLALTQQCTGLPTCSTYQYRYTAFTGCPSCLQTGQTAFATRTAICQVSTNGGASYVDDTTANNANCVAAGVQLLALTQQCTGLPTCAIYQYRYTAFTGCPSCLQTGQTAFATRTAICQVSNNGGTSYTDDTTANNANCVAAGVTLLALTQQCTGLPACVTYSYQTTAYGSCSVSCGAGVATRTVTCVGTDSQTYPLSTCATALGTAAPASSQACNNGPCCIWQVGEFGTCSQQCPINGISGTQTRTVTCRDRDNINGGVQTDACCVSSTVVGGGVKPITQQNCNTFCVRITGDPEFVGFLGQKYEIHGVPNSVFNIITSPLMQYNALFVYIGEKSAHAAQCNATRTHPWTHAGTYLGRLGFKTSAGDRIEMQSGSCLDGIKSVRVNGKLLAPGQRVELKPVAGHAQSLIYKNQYDVAIHLAEVDIALTNSDNFFNQAVTMTEFGESKLQTHGLLGQTWRDATYVTEGVRRVTEGVSTDYMIQDEDLFGNEFLFNRFPVDA